MTLTLMQKTLGPVLNYLVETFFPEGAFFGGDYLKDLESETELVERWGSVEMACAMLITSKVRGLGATRAVLEAHEVTDKGNPVGSWRMTVEEIDTTTTPTIRRASLIGDCGIDVDR